MFPVGADTFQNLRKIIIFWHSQTSQHWQHLDPLVTIKVSLIHQTVHYCNTLHCTDLYCSPLHCTPLHCTALHCTALSWTHHLTAQHCIFNFPICHGLWGGQYFVSHLSHFTTLFCHTKALQSQISVIQCMQCINISAMPRTKGSKCIHMKSVLHCIGRWNIIYLTDNFRYKIYSD